MAINSLYKTYFQKSKTFLYPLLEIKRGVSVTPMQTYITWKKGDIELKNRKLICKYHIREDREYINFEKLKLMGHELFHRFEKLDDGTGVYIFDMASIGIDWTNIIQGRYSQLSTSHKKTVKDFYGENNADYTYVDSYLNPERYFSLYSELLNVTVENLKEVGELCSAPDLEKETLTAEIEQLKLMNYV